MKLKEYVCPSCGAVLNVDKTLKIYRCQFCGVSYDYNYFMSDDVLDRAYSYLHNKEYKAAKEAFEFILQKEPNNALAYRGLLLVHAQISDTKYLRDKRVIQNLKFKEMEEVVSQALENVGEEDIAFFEDFRELLETTKEYKNAKELQDTKEDLFESKDQKADLLYRKASNAKSNARFKFIFKTFGVMFLLFIILGIAEHFFVGAYMCKVNKSVVKTLGFVIDEENDGSVRNEADWSFIASHEGGKTHFLPGETYYPRMQNDVWLSIYLKNGSTYFTFVCIAIAVVAVVYIVFQSIRHIIRMKAVNVDEMYDEAKMVKSDALNDKNEFEENRKKAYELYSDLTRIFRILIQDDPMTRK